MKQKLVGIFCLLIVCLLIVADKNGEEPEFILSNVGEQQGMSFRDSGLSARHGRSTARLTETIDELKHVEADQQFYSRPLFKKIPQSGQCSLSESERLVKLSSSFAQLKPQDTFQLNLFDDFHFEMVVENVETKNDNKYMAKAKIKSLDGSEGQAVLVYNSGQLAASVTHPDHESVLIDYVGQGVHRIRKLDDADVYESSTQFTANSIEPDAHANGDAEGTGDDVIDMAFVYTPDFVASQGGVENAQNLIDLAVAELNVVFLNSQLSVKVNLVHSQELPFDHNRKMRHILNDATHGQINGLWDIRDQHNADIVCLLVDSEKEGGRSWLINKGISDEDAHKYGYMVLRGQQIVGGRHSLAQEFGHLLGCAHDRTYVSKRRAKNQYRHEGYFEYSYGHKFVAKITKQKKRRVVYKNKLFKTLMSRGQGKRIPYYSNPEVKYLGVNTGKDEGYGDTAANNAKTISLRSGVVSNFRQAFVNSKPVADAGYDVTIVDNDRSGFELVNLSGKDSLDPDSGQSLSYEWSLNGQVLGRSMDLSLSLPIGVHRLILTVTDSDSNNPLSSQDIVVVTVEEKPLQPNTAPVADAGVDIQVTDLDGDGFVDVTLNGSNSYDPDGDSIKVTWFINGVSSLSKIKWVTRLPVGTYDVILRVTDVHEDSMFSEDTMTVTIEPQPINVNNAPVADAGEDIVVEDIDGDGFADVTLNGLNSYDVDGHGLSYWWTEGENYISSRSKAVVTFPVGEHIIVLHVQDDDPIFPMLSYDYVTVVVTPKTVTENQPPIAVAGPDITVTDIDGDGLADVTLNGRSSSDPDGALTNFYWVAEGELISRKSKAVVGLPVGTHNIDLTVFDDGNPRLRSSDRIVVTILP